MEFVITRGSFEIHPLPSQHPDAPEGARGGYLLNVVDEATGIVVRVSMAYANAAQLGHVLVSDTQAHPWQAPEAPGRGPARGARADGVLSGGEGLHAPDGSGPDDLQEPGA